MSTSGAYVGLERARGELEQALLENSLAGQAADSAGGTITQVTSDIQIAYTRQLNDVSIRNADDHLQTAERRSGESGRAASRAMRLFNTAIRSDGINEKSEPIKRIGALGDLVCKQFAGENGNPKPAQELSAVKTGIDGMAKRFDAAATLSETIAEQLALARAIIGEAQNAEGAAYASIEAMLGRLG